MSEFFKGVEALSRTLCNIADEVPREVGVALFREAQLIKTASIKRTPKDLGTLRNTHEVMRPVISGHDVSVEISVGGPTAASPQGAGYALIVHEDLEARHTVGEAKFLEKSVNESASGLAERVAKRIDLNNRPTGGNPFGDGIKV